ncbi:MAG TPA: hypothetical protein VI483_00965 [Candidatus Paceibacterota bacterium]
MSWVYIELPLFIRSCDKISISEQVRDSIKLWAPTVGRSETPRLKIVFRSPLNRYEAWNARIPDPRSNKGKSRGYRLMYYLDLKEGTINLLYIEERDELGFGKEGKRKKNSYNDLVRDLKEMLCKMEADDT